MLNELAKEINENARNKGFWDDMHISLEQLQSYANEYGCSDDIEKATKDAYISQKIALVMSECGEALEAMRKNKYGIEQKDTFEDEIADSIIRLLDLCAELDIDIEKQIKWKMRFNSTREAKHGKAF